eukprot:scaffold125458_cov26-Prasinocladus_malaysianus.AAC.2
MQALYSMSALGFVVRWLCCPIMECKPVHSFIPQVLLLRQIIDNIQSPRVTTCTGSHLTSRSTRKAYYTDTCKP